MISVSRMVKEKNLDFLIDGLTKVKELIRTPFKCLLVGDGMVLIEAMAGGCPVVAVRASGVHDVVKDGHNGLMVAESTESWTKAVATLLADRQRLVVLSENSRLFAEDYSEEKIAEKVLKLNRRVVVLRKSNNT